MPESDLAPVPEQGVVRFGRFEMDFGAGQLRRGGHAVRLRSQPFKVLSALVVHPGRIISREELRALLWGDDTHVDFDQGLNYCVKEIRAALSDQADAPAFVETLPRRGYRWIGPPAAALTTAEPAVPVEEQPALEVLPGPIPCRPWRHPGHLALTSLALAAVLVMVWRWPAGAPTWRRLTYQRGAVGAARFGPAGAILYSAAWSGEPSRIHVVQSGLPDARTLGPAEARLAAVDAGDVMHLGVASVGLLQRTSLVGGPAKDLLDQVIAADSRGDQQAVIRAVPREGAVLAWPPDRRIRRTAADALRLAPDGRHLALIERPLDDAGGVLLVVDPAGTVVSQSGEWGSIRGLAWTPDSREVWFAAAAAGDDRALLGLDLRGRTRRVLPASGGLVLHDLASDGRALVERRIERTEVRFETGTGPGRDLAWFDASTPAGLSADGRWLLFSELGEAGGARRAVYLRATDGAPAVRLGDGLATDLTADGRTALAVAQPAGDHLTLFPVGAGSPRQLRHAGLVRYQWAGFFPDGQRLLVSAQEPGRNMRVWVADLLGGKPRALTPEGLVVTRNTISPDGQWVAAPCPVRTSCLYPSQGGEPRPIPGLGDARPVGWDTQGRLLVRDRAWPAQVDRLDVSIGARTPWRALGSSDPVGLASPGSVLAAPDTRAWITSCTRALSELFVLEGLR